MLRHVQYCTDCKKSKAIKCLYHKGEKFVSYRLHCGHLKFVRKR